MIAVRVLASSKAPRGLPLPVSFNPALTGWHPPARGMQTSGGAPPKSAAQSEAIQAAFATITASYSPLSTFLIECLRFPAGRVDRGPAECFTALAAETALPTPRSLPEIRQRGAYQQSRTSSRGTPQET